MSICPSCEGVIGRDCFNPEECMSITQSQAAESEAARYNAEESQHNLQQLKAEIAAIATEFDTLGPGSCGGEHLKSFYALVIKLRQLSAV